MNLRLAFAASSFAAAASMACASTPAPKAECPSGTILSEGSCIPLSDEAQEARLKGAPTVATVNDAGPQAPYDREAVDPLLKRAAKQVKDNCGAATNDDGKALGPWGPTRISVTLDRRGRTGTVSVPPPYSGTPGGNCAVKAFSKMIFPPYAAPSDSIVEVDIDIAEPGKK